jgi:hypothetical protein
MISKLCIAHQVSKREIKFPFENERMAGKKKTEEEGFKVKWIFFKID